jgi:uncharacterized membrane protein
LGYPQFILATALIKFCEGGLVGLMAGKPRDTRFRPAAGLALGVAVLVGGYFVFEAFIYPALGKVIPFFAVTDMKAALAEIFPNLLQGILSAVIAFGIGRVFRRQNQ